MCVNFQCNLCSYTTTKAFNLKRHKRQHQINTDDKKYDGTECLYCALELSNKYSCRRHMERFCKHNPIYKNDNDDAENVNTYAENVNTHAENVNTHANSNAENVNISLSCHENAATVKCPDCYKCFTSKRGLAIHQDNCEKISDPMQCPKCMKILSCTSSKSRHMKSCKGSTSVLVPTATTTQIMNQQNANVINNTTNSNNTTNNTIHIHINNFGHERLDHISPELLTTCFRAINGVGVARLVGEIHCNPEVPDNQNVRIDSIKGKTLMIRKNNEWIIKDANEVVNLLISNGCSILYNHYDSTPALKKEDREQHSGMLLQNLCTVSNKHPKYYHPTKRCILATMKNLKKVEPPE